MHRLADEAFASGLSPPTDTVPRVQSVPPARANHTKPPVKSSSQVVSREVSQSRKSSDVPRSEVSRAQSIISSNPDLQAISSQNTAKYVSTGTSTTDLTYDAGPRNPQRVSQIYPANNDIPRPTSLPQQADLTGETGRPGDGRSNVQARVSSYQPQVSQARQVPQPSGRQSLDVSRPPPELIEPTPRIGINPNRSRPPSMSLEGSTMEFLREREGASRPQSRLAQPSPRDSPKVPSPLIPSPNLIPTEVEQCAESNDLEFLRGMEDAEGKSNHKRSSLHSISGSKHLLATRFGDAFKKFENHGHIGHHHSSSSGRNSMHLRDNERPDLTPIEGSVATDGRSDDGHFYDEAEHMSPERRRSIERRRLEEEERRVEAAQAEYRKRVAEGGTGSDATPLPRSIGGVPRALSIQNRVQSLLNEGQRSAEVPKTATGYGKYSDAASVTNKSDKPLPEVPRKPISVNNTQGSSFEVAPPMPPRPGKPAAPKKPARLNSLPPGNRPPSPAKPSSQNRAPAERLVAVDLPGQPSLEMTADDKDNYIRDFSQRFPSLGAMEGSSRGCGTHYFSSGIHYKPIFGFLDIEGGSKLLEIRYCRGFIE
jgi:AP2-associated kinase